MTDFNDFVDALVVDTIGGSEKIPDVKANVSGYITPLLLKSYIITELLTSGSLTPASGDNLVTERSGAEGLTDLDALAAYVYDVLYDAAAITPLVSGDLLLLERAGVKKRFDIDTLVNFVNSENGTLGAQIIGLASVTIDDAHEFVISESGTAKKFTVADVTAKANAAFNGYVTALASAGTPAGTDTLYIQDGATSQKITIADILAYMDGTMTLDGGIAWPSTTLVGASAAGDKILMYRAGTIEEVDIDVLVTYFGTGLQPAILDFSGLAAATPNAADRFVVDDGGTEKKLTLANLETKLWADFKTYVLALGQNVTVTGTDKLWCSQGGTAKYLEIDEIGTYLTVTDGDVIAPASTTEHSFPQWDSAAKTLKDGFPFVTTVNFDGTESDTKLASEKAVSDAVEDATNIDIAGTTEIGGALAATDEFLVEDATDSVVKSCLMSRIPTYLETVGLSFTAPTVGFGYGTGAGSAVTQITTRTTSVTINAVCGAITLVSAAGSATYRSFTVTNSTVEATDTIIVNQKSGTDLYKCHVTAVAAGSFQITSATVSGTTTEQPVLNFTVIKSVAA